MYSIHFQLDKALLDAYEYMQKYAVGLEQIVWDQEEHHLEFHKQFQDTEYELRTVSLFLRIKSVILQLRRVREFSICHSFMKRGYKKKKRKRNRCARLNSSGAISLNYSFSCDRDKKHFAKLYERFT